MEEKALIFCGDGRGANIKFSSLPCTLDGFWVCVFFFSWMMLGSCVTYTNTGTRAHRTRVAAVYAAGWRFRELYAEGTNTRNRAQREESLIPEQGPNPGGRQRNKHYRENADTPESSSRPSRPPIDPWPFFNAHHTEGRSDSTGLQPTNLSPVSRSVLR